MRLAEETPAWMADAACAGADVELWFPPRGRNATEAKRICASCPVRLQCLDYALAHHETVGIWGGMDRKQRAAVARERRAA